MSEDHATFLFADLAGYTALTEAHGDERAADLAEAFCERVCAIEDEHGANDVKTIGDAVMSRAADADQAVALALRIVDEIGQSHGFPAVRAGMHRGPAVRRRDDWFGATINVASRVAALAEPHQVLLTEATREAAGSMAGVELRPLGERRLRNVAAPVRLWAARSKSPPQLLPVDPVCRMTVDPALAADRAEHGGRTHWFCSQRCANAFRERPESYAEAAKDAPPGSGLS